MQLAVDSAEHGASTVLSVSGELDIATVRVLREAVDKAVASAPPRLLLDLSDLAFIDSTGCRELVQTSKNLASRGTSVEIVCPTANRRVRRIVDFLQLQLLLPVHERMPPA